MSVDMKKKDDSRGEEDPLKYRPNPDMLVSKSTVATQVIINFLLFFFSLYTLCRLLVLLKYRYDKIICRVEFSSSSTSKQFFPLFFTFSSYYSFLLYRIEILLSFFEY